MKAYYAAVLLAVLGIPAAHADESHHKPAATASAEAAPLAEGEVRRVDKDAKKITIRHGPLPSLDMPPMTMVFQVKDPALLEKVKAGDKVRFRAEKEGSTYLVTAIEQ